jgi:hypothetical protein
MSIQEPFFKLSMAAILALEVFTMLSKGIIGSPPLFKD